MGTYDISVCSYVWDAPYMWGPLDLDVSYIWMVSVYMDALPISSSKDVVKRRQHTRLRRQWRFHRIGDEDPSDEKMMRARKR